MFVDVAGCVRGSHLPTLSVLVTEPVTGELGGDAELQRAWLPADCHHHLLTDLVTYLMNDLVTY